MHSPRSTSTALLAIGATTLALSLPTAAHAASTTRVKTNGQLTKVVPDDVDHVKFSGKVKSKRAVCERRRTVKLRQVDQDLAAGRDKANRKGAWRISFDGNKIMPGEFRMTVTKKV
ncbi:hypothetical protein ncot_00460 [Nocardioides sp. JQ2195]|uniref:hypothetical protein n=1 Tax=Nocardioides sp. JQ2195 TaxID=2592334 RepID=UPI00143E72F5|nr:hypothetical protein [Nocardioides sp. JQ2195]QIX25223.1 hypothetical protein ncot_00460 [Nocardioides sp. JQ2195]